MAEQKFPDGITSPESNGYESKLESFISEFKTLSEDVQHIIKILDGSTKSSIFKFDDDFVSALNKSYRYLMSKEAFSVENLKKSLDTSFNYIEKIKNVIENFPTYQQEDKNFKNLQLKQFEKLLAQEEKRNKILQDIYSIENNQSNLLGILFSKEAASAKQAQKSYEQKRKEAGFGRIIEEEREFNKTKVATDKETLGADIWQGIINAENPISQMLNVINTFRGGRTEKQHQLEKEKLLIEKQKDVLKAQNRYIPNIESEEDREYVLQKYNKLEEYEKLQKQHEKKINQLEKLKPIESKPALAAALTNVKIPEKVGIESEQEQEQEQEEDNIVPFSKVIARKKELGLIEKPEIEEKGEKEEEDNIVPFSKVIARKKELGLIEKPEIEEKGEKEEEDNIVPLMIGKEFRDLNISTSSILQEILALLQENIPKISENIIKIGKNFIALEAFPKYFDEIIASSNGKTIGEFHFPEKFHKGGILKRGGQVIAQEGELILPVEETNKAISSGLIQQSSAGGVEINPNYTSSQQPQELIEIAKNILEVLKNDIVQNLNNNEPSTITTLNNDMNIKSISFG